MGSDGGRGQLVGAGRNAEGAVLRQAQVLRRFGMALPVGADVAAGQGRDTNLNTYTPLRMADRPALDIRLVAGLAAPVGLDEPATTVVAPAIGNAIFAATGARVTHPSRNRPAAVLAAIGTP
ncbi:hypothetical protein NX862_14425 [Rhodobacter sp. KR11]|uniref:hypothetical protein n=1 Tax=Rhodobacter sp. KR11 TaxID=2974588 RepID=UPI002223A9E9|nr:hypothetical protein [Rhodobacter sp. KR11]MCW1919953.1 hypothetical protein [Rhodobacter sp. KR11]